MRKNSGRLSFSYHFSLITHLPIYFPIISLAIVCNCMFDVPS
jgi:hypothetical protein